MKEKDWAKSMWEFLDQLVATDWKGKPSSEKSLTDLRLRFHNLVEDFQDKEKTDHPEASLHGTRRLIYGTVNELMLREDKEWLCRYIQKFRRGETVASG